LALVDLDAAEALTGEPRDEAALRPVPDVLAGLVVLAVEAIPLAQVDRHGDEHPLADLGDELLRFLDVLEAVPAADGFGGVGVDVEVALPGAQPGDRLGVDVVAPAIGFEHEAAR